MLSVNPVDSLSSGSSQAEEECLRPSRIRRKFHLFHDITNLSTAVNSSPLQDIMALASPTPCASNRPASACFSPNAETNLFGSPVPSVYTPAARHQHGIGHSMAVQSPRLQHLQKQHTALLQNLNDYKAYQARMEAYLQDKAFLTEQLERVQGHCADSPIIGTIRRVEQQTQTNWSESIGEERQQVSPIRGKELWQQLSFASSDAEDASDQIETLQAELAESIQQLSCREAAAATLHIQHSEAQSQLESLAQQVERLEQEKAQIAQTAAATASGLVDQLDCAQQQHQQALISLQLQHQQAVENMQQHHRQEIKTVHCSSASLALEQEVAEAHEQITGLAEQLKLAEQQHEGALQELQTHSAETESCLMDQLQELQQHSADRQSHLLDQLQQAQQECADIAVLHAEVESLKTDKARITEAAALTESALLDDAALLRHEHEASVAQLQQSLAEAQRVLSQQQQQAAEHVAQQVASLQAELQQFEQGKADITQSAAETESRLMEQLDLLHQQHGQDLQALRASHFQTEAAVKQSLSQANAENAALREESAATQRQLAAVTSQLAEYQASETPLHGVPQSVTTDQLAHAQRDSVAVVSQPTASDRAQDEPGEQVDQAQRASPQLAHSQVLIDSILIQQQRSITTAACSRSEGVRADVSSTLEPLQPHDGDGVIRQALADAQHELATVLAALAVSQTAQAALAESLAQASNVNAEQADVHTLTEGALLEQLHEAQVEQLRLEIHVRHLDDRHSEINRQLIFARASQAKAGGAESEVTEQLVQTQQDVERLQESLLQSQGEASALRAELTASREQRDTSAEHETELSQQLQQSEAALSSQQQARTAIEGKLRKYKACYHDVRKQLNAAKTQAADASQKLQQSQAAHQHQLGEVQHCLNLHISQAAGSDEQHLAVQAALDTASKQLEQSQLDHKALQSQLRQSDVLMQASKAETAAALAQMEQSHLEVKALQCQLAQSGTDLQHSNAEKAVVTQQLAALQRETTITQEQLTQSQVTVQHLKVGLEAAICDVNESKQQFQQQMSENASLQTECFSCLQQLQTSQQVGQQLNEQLANSQKQLQLQRQELQQLKDDIQHANQQHVQELQHLRESENEQRQLVAELQQQVQRGSDQLQEQQQDRVQLSCQLEEAQHTQHKVAAELQGLYEAQSEMEGKAGEGSLLIQELRVHLAAAQAHLLAQQARLQVHEREAETATKELQQAGRSLAYVLHQQDTFLPSAATSACSLREATDQVCGLAEGLLLHHTMLQTLPTPATGASGLTQPKQSLLRPVCEKPGDSLSSHVAAAQARANHIVEEFESMLLVTGGHSAKEIQAMQSQAGLGEAEQAKLVHSQGRFTRLTAVRSEPPAPTLSVTDRKGHSKTSCVDCACGPSPHDHSSMDVKTKCAAGAASRTSIASCSAKSKARALKENIPPSLTFVSGGQVRGARKPHGIVSKHAGKSTRTESIKVTEQISHQFAVSAQLAYTSRLHN